jgi:2Fe-2S ferredoxin
MSTAAEATVRVQPAGHVFPVAPGETIMAAAQRAGFRWPTICGGKASCRTCVFTLVDGADRVAAPSSKEAEALALVRRPGSRAHAVIRLACQTTTSGDLVISKPGVRPIRGER